MSLAPEIGLIRPAEFMHLTLTFTGPLHTQTEKNTRVAEKHTIRRQFQKQLRDVWITHPELGEEAFNTQVLKRSSQQRLGDEIGLPLPTSKIGEFVFVPLVSSALWAVCELDILFLRREPAGGIVNFGGDIDNRLKVLFDALRMPREAKELPQAVSPDSDEKPFACLLEHDSLITTVRVESERLLGPVEPESPANVKLVMQVTIKVQKLTYWNFGLGDNV
jgi:hypothetical protein